MKKQSMIFVCVCFLSLFSANAIAERRPKACAPNICQPRASIPKQFKPLISAQEGLITLKPKVLASGFSLNPDQGTAVPQIAVPADRNITTICHLNLQGKLICHEEVTLTGCPKFISLTVDTGAGLAIAECDLTCEPDTPDPSTGTCECDPVNCRIN